MATVLAIISLAIALVSVWFTTEALRRANSHGDAIVKPHLRQVNAKIRDGRGLIEDIDARLRKIERQVEVLKIDSRAAHELEQQTQELRQSVEQSRRFVPSRVMSA